MRILIALTYYRPHTSGLTIYAERLAKAFAKRGHQVTVLTSQFDKNLPREEIDEGVHIVRVPVLLRISKGVIMPTLGFVTNRLVKENDVIQLHLPQFDAAGIAFRGRLLRKPTVITYHCDLRMPPGLFNKAANVAILFMNNLAALFTHRFVTYTQDYADHSPYLKGHMEKLRVILPPVVLPEVPESDIEAFGKQHNPENRRPVIGMAARFATEKGVEILLNAMDRVLEVYPNALVQFAGPYENIIGEEKYYQRLSPKIKAYQEKGNWQFLGTLDPATMVSFYRNIDVLVMSSLNSTEAFGLVQIEAMINGTPSIASSLPGVRQPVKMHGMGKVFPIGDSKALAEDILDVLGNPQAYQRDPQEVASHYLPDQVAAEYEVLFKDIFKELGKELPNS